MSRVPHLTRAVSRKVGLLPVPKTESGVPQATRHHRVTWAYSLPSILEPSMNLFEDQTPTNPITTTPLAERMRPTTLADYAGQQHLLAPGKPLRLAIDTDDPTSIILWGPPGVGKTTLAKIIAHLTNSSFIEFSAVLSGIKEIKTVMAQAEKLAHHGSRTILFVDEIHRFNKAQQDAFLPYVERGTIRLIGATTENPSFELNAALLSRCRVYTLQPLTPQDIEALLQRALLTYKIEESRHPERSAPVSSAHGVEGPREPEMSPRTLTLSATNHGVPETTLSTTLTITPEALTLLTNYASGDARTALNALEVAAHLTQAAHASTITQEQAAEATQRRLLLYDKSGEQHYDLISALHKSVRNSDPDAALYWLTRMLASGEDPMYCARRIVRMAVEDIGLAAPEALNLCLSARDAMHFLGSPEGDLALAQAVVYLALAPKSNSVYKAHNEIKRDLQSTLAEPVPLHLRNAPTKLMQSLDYGRDYQYAHDHEHKLTNMQCLPDSLKDRQYYHPTQEGRERQLAARLEEIKALKSQPD